VNPSRTYAIALRQFYLMRGSPARVLPLFAWVTIDILLWGFITRYLGSITAPGTARAASFVPALLGAVLLWDFLVRVMHGITTAFLEDVWSRNFLNIFATPLSLNEYIGGLVLTGAITSAVGLIAMLILASTVFGLHFFAYGLLLIPFLMLLFLFGIALGIVGSGIVLRLGPAAEWFIWPLPALISPFACVFYPLSTLPRWMQIVSRTVPPSYVFEAMREIAVGQPTPLAILAGGMALALMYIALAGWFFSVVYRHAVRTGLIPRYSAESVS
jgi:ABC-2 type transport system permease protein